MNHSRTILEITGDDRISFLQGLLTQDVTKLAEARMQFAALLSPQGKILHDMFLIACPEAIWLDTPQPYAETLRKRLMMYRLRAKVAITEAATAVSLVAPQTPEALPDPRHPLLPWRWYGTLPDAQCLATTALSLGIPDSVGDFAPDSITAMDAGYDLLHAISFTKGCYVGQEVTARMHYKSIARKGFFIIEAAGDLPSGAPVMRGDKPLATLGHSAGGRGLAFLKFDDALGDAPLTVHGQPVRRITPDWMAPKIAQYQASAPMQ